MRIADGPRVFARLAVSPVNPSLIYGAGRTDGPVQDQLGELQVSHDAGVTWEVVREHRGPNPLSGPEPTGPQCVYQFLDIQPHSVDAARLFTLEGCLGATGASMSRPSAKAGVWRQGREPMKAGRQRQAEPGDLASLPAQSTPNTHQVPTGLRKFRPDALPAALVGFGWGR